MPIDRREFLQAVGASVAASAAGGSADSVTPTAEPARADAAPSALCFMSGRELATMIRARKLSARELMAAELAQITRVNPRINAIVAKLDDQKCLALADEAD